jgi:phosphatidylinositol dimannoside acyltransferase
VASGRPRRPPDEGRLIQLVYYGYVAGSAVARAIPERAAYGFARLLGSYAARRSKKRPFVERNLARITGLRADSSELNELVVEAYRSYARYWLETFRLVREGPEFFLERFVCKHNDRIEEVRSRGRGAIVVVGHLGNWDAAGAWVSATGRKLVTVAEVLKPKRMFDFFADHRAKLGMTIFPAQAGAIAELARAVDEGAVVAILGDRDLRGRGPKVDFFGEKTTFPAGPAVVALKTGVPLLVAGVYGVERPDGKKGWVAEISLPIELPDEKGKEAIAELTQRVANVLEGFVAKHPEEWHVFNPFWLADR